MSVVFSLWYIYALAVQPVLLAIFDLVHVLSVRRDFSSRLLFVFRLILSIFFVISAAFCVILFGAGAILHYVDGDF